MNVLVANIGSTSLKWRLFDVSSVPERLLHKGGFERVTDYAAAIENCLAELKSAGVIRSESDLAAVGFKTVLAKDVTGCVELDERVLQAMAEYAGLAPAHNPPYITGIRLFKQRMPGIPLVGLFETAFYQFAPPAMMRYAVPAAWHDAGVRRFGFHGASHKFIAERSAELLGRNDVAERARRLYVDNGRTPVSGLPLRVISCHLGGSSSVTGILNGAAIGTSMGMSPQSGLPQNNRVGDLDAEALPYAMKALGLSLEEAQRQLRQESGLKGLSGVSNDIREVQEAASSGNRAAQMAIDVFVASARHWIGSYYFELNGADAIVFTAGIGENRPEIREAICANLDQLGIVLDPERNRSTRAAEGVVSADSSPVKVLVIPTNEELVVAREVKRFLEKNRPPARTPFPSQLSTVK
ncbi:MAG TPA: acetate kinase [Verrucomicrobia bacterium]|nr:acetate kinase [Verrucomicrobiota bacterium]HOP98764.1 acetate kinase [Verrucomicrobiota bacterium]HPU55328.1 acetate kinase [Verrucomicrobiota bacterium]